MSWQLLIWNIFVWTFTGLMIYVTNSSLWWLLIPLLLTMTNDAAELIRATKEEEKVEDDFELDSETRARMQKLLEKSKRGGF